MAAANELFPERATRDNQHDILRQVRELFDKQEVVAELVHKQRQERQSLVETLTRRQQETEFDVFLRRQHPADIAFVIENLPFERRLKVWRALAPQAKGAVLIELSDAVREYVIASETREGLIQALSRLATEDIASLLPHLTKEVADAVIAALDSRDREQVRSALAFPADSVGALMAFDFITVPQDKTVAEVQLELRRRAETAGKSHYVFLSSDHGRYAGAVPVVELLLHEPGKRIGEIAGADLPVFRTHDRAREAASAFERYDLISAPVVNAHQQLVGHLSIDAVLEYLQDRAQRDLLTQAGVAEEDMFASVWQSSRNRFNWLAVNLLTAFIASRVIGAFETTIEHIVALASLLPVVASLAGNTGNQTVALVIRGLSLNQVTRENLFGFLSKEVMVSLVNGLIWGSVIGVFTLVLYGRFSLALVVLLAAVINLLIAALSGVLIPYVLRQSGRDPVFGSSVLLTGLTDSMGFLATLGLGTLLLVQA
jgi:magnesium transporter